MDKKIGLKYWKNDRPDKNGTYYVQDNNATEKLLAKSHNKDQYLETCGPTSAVSLLSARGDDINCNFPGEYQMQPEDALTIFFHDPQNRPVLEAARALRQDQWFGNRIPQWYPVAIQAVFGVECSFHWGLLKIDQLKELLSRNIGVMLQLNNPGHYIAVVAFDYTKDEIIYNDPWPGNYWPERLRGSSGERRQITMDEYYSNIANFHILFGV